MAAGDLLTRKNGAETTILPNAGTNLDSTWDTQVRAIGSDMDYLGGNFTLDTGIYLIMYSEKFSTTNTTNNERIEVQGEIHQVGTGAIGGYGQDYIRKSSGQQSCSVSGYTIVEVTADNTDFFIRFYRTDNSTSGTVNRVPNSGGVTILELDDAHNFGLYSTSASEATSGNSERILGLDTNDRQDAGFSRSGTGVTVSNPGRYLITYTLDISQTATGREDVVSRITNAGTELSGSHGYCYLRGADGCQDGALTCIGIFDLAGGEVLDVRWQAPQSATVTAAAGARLQIWQLPATADVAVMQATDGDYNAVGQFAFDTLPTIDTDSFTATAGQTNIDSDQTDFLLSFATFHQNAPDTVQRGYPELRMRVEGVNSEHATAGVYHRNSGGSGVVAVTIADLLFVNSDDSLEVSILPNGAAGSMNNDSAQFSLLSLESVFGPYVFPPSIFDFNTDESFDFSDTDLIITGANFGSVQGAGKVELWSDGVGTVKSLQSIDTWSDTSIQVDMVQGGLTGDTSMFLVVTSDTGSEAIISVNEGVLPYTDVIKSLTNAPDHYHTFNNTYDDEVGGLAANSQNSSGTSGFVATPLTRNRTHAWRPQDTVADLEMTDSPFTNVTNLHRRRFIGGWINIPEIPLDPKGIWEEGGGVNNLYIVIGFGGKILCNVADSSNGWKLQGYSDILLTPGRTYHVGLLFGGQLDDDGCFCYIDGVRQSVNDGAPTSTTMATHSGDWSYGRPDGNLDTGGTDIQYPAWPDLLYNDWATWSNTGNDIPPDSDIRVEIFEKGAVETVNIASDTPANMQLAVDALSGNNYADETLAIRVSKPSGGGDLDLDFDNITFGDRTSIQVMWMGSTGQTLTITNRNGSNVEESKCSTAYGGSLTVVNPATLTLTGLQSPTEVRVCEAGTQNDLAGEENVTSGTFSASIEVPSVDIIIHALGFQHQRLKSVDTSASVSLPIQQRVDRQYENA